MCALKRIHQLLARSFLFEDTGLIVRGITPCDDDASGTASGSSKFCFHCSSRHVVSLPFRWHRSANLVPRPLHLELRILILARPRIEHTASPVNTDLEDA
jgi:hypothetical protein